MMPTIEILGLSLSSYWVMCVVGMLLVVVFCVLQLDKYNIKLWQGIVLALSVNVFGVLGVFLLGYVQSGFTDMSPSFMGAMIFTPIFVGVISKLFRVDVLDGISISAIPIASMGACMKIGCFLNGCCGGIVINGVEFPVQLVEACISIVIVVVLFVLQRKLQDFKTLFAWYMVMYSVTRFFIEYLRDTPKNILLMSMGQVTSLIVLVLGMVFLVIYKKMTFKQSN